MVRCPLVPRSAARLHPLSAETLPGYENHPVLHQLPAAPPLTA